MSPPLNGITPDRLIQADEFLTAKRVTSWTIECVKPGCNIKSEGHSRPDAQRLLRKHIARNHDGWDSF